MEHDLQPESNRALLQNMMRNIHDALKQTNDSLCELSANYEYLEFLIACLRESNDPSIAQQFIDRLLASNREKLDLAKTQRNISLKYLFINPFIYFLSDLTYIVPGFADWLVHEVFNESTQTLHTPDNGDDGTLSAAGAIRKFWESMAGAARTAFATQIYVETRDKIDNASRTGEIALSELTSAAIPIPQMPAYSHYDIWHRIWKCTRRFKLDFVHLRELISRDARL
jgi:hypothetical protein